MKSMIGCDITAVQDFAEMTFSILDQQTLNERTCRVGYCDEQDPDH